MYLLDPNLANLRGQVIYLDFDGAQHVRYNGPAVVDDIEVPPFSAAAIGLAGHEAELARTITSLVADALGPLGVTVTCETPSSGEYSTVYVGGDDSRFSEYGRFSGLAESVDVGNTARTDVAFVFSETVEQSSSAAGSFGIDSFTKAVADVVVHEAGHQIGACHTGSGNVAAMGPLDAVAHKMEEGMEVHQWITKQAYDLYCSQFDFGTSANGAGELGSYLAKPGLAANMSWDWSQIAPQLNSYNGNNNIIEGSHDEDIEDNPFGNSYPYDRHFCQGGDDTELTTGLAVRDPRAIYDSDAWFDELSTYYSAYEQACKLWNGWEGENASQIGATDLYLVSQKATAYWYLGHIVHLLEDMTVPAHVHGDPHPGFWYGDDDQYEDWLGENSQFQQYGYSAGSCHTASNWDIALPSSLENVFRLTTDYTEDYRSDDRSSGELAEYAVDYRSSDRHHPEAITGSGDLTNSQCATVAKDLMPWAIEQTASLFRLFYQKVDKGSPPVVTLDSNIPSDPNNAPVFATTSVAIHGDANDPESGVDIDGYHFLTRRYDGGQWYAWTDHGASGKTATLTLDGDGLYAVQLTAENGGGYDAESRVGYIQIATPKPNPDLSVALFDVPATGTVGQSIGAMVQVANLGDGASAASSVQFWLSANASFDGADRLLSQVNNLAAIAAHDYGPPRAWALSIPNDVVPGDYWVFAKVIPGDVQDDPTNNIGSDRITLISMAPPKPDLHPSLADAPLSATVGNSISVSTKVDNLTNGASPPYTIEYWLSTDRTLVRQGTGADRLLKRMTNRPGIAGNSFVTWVEPVDMSAGTSAGTYYVAVCVNPDQAITETSYANNIQFDVDSILLIAPVQPKPDFDPLRPEAPPIGTIGSTIAVDTRVQNLWSVASSAYVIEFWLSTDPTVRGAGDNSDRSLGRVSRSGIVGNGEDRWTQTLSVPSDMSPGQYWIGVFVNPDQTVLEANYTNNIDVDDDPIVLTRNTAQADLVGEGLQLDPGTPRYVWGQSYFVSDTVKNIGTLAANASTVEFYLSDSPLIPENHRVKISSRQVTSLSPNSSSPSHDRLTLPGSRPAGFASGTLFIGMVVDAGWVVNESSAGEANNKGRGQGIDVAALLIEVPNMAPDLIGVDFDLEPRPATYGWGQSLHGDFQFKNQGDAYGNGPFSHGLYLSHDTVFDAGDFPVARSTYYGIASGATLAGAFRFSLPSSPPAGFGNGNMYIISVVDDLGDLIESNEPNNSGMGFAVDYRDVYISGTPATPGAPTIGDFTVNPTTFTRGEKIDLLATGVVDDGVVNDVIFYLDSNGSGTLDDSDRYITSGSKMGTTFDARKSTDGWETGSRLIFAQAKDNFGELSQVKSVLVNIQGLGPFVEDQYENNDSRDTATLLGGGTYFQLNNLAHGDEDWFAIDVPYGPNVQLDVQISFFQEAGSGVTGDLALEVYSGYGSNVGFSNSSQPGNTSERVLTSFIGAQVRYYVHVYSEVNPHYDLTIRVTPDPAYPTLTNLAATPGSLYEGGNVTITVDRVNTSGGAGAYGVYLWRDANKDGQVTSEEEIGRDLGIPDGPGGKWSVTVSTAGWSAGPNTIFASGQDTLYRSGLAQSVVVDVKVNVPPRIGSLTAPVSTIKGDDVTLVAEDVTDVNGDSSVTEASFYLDTNGDGLLDATDTDLGIGTKVGTDWSIIVPGSSLAAGEHRFFAVAGDERGATSDSVSTTVEVIDPPPQIGGVVAPRSVMLGNTMTLVATDVTGAPDAVDSLAFFLDSNGNGSLDDFDLNLGTGLQSGDDWSLVVPTGNWEPGFALLFAKVLDCGSPPQTTVSGAVVFVEQNEAPVLAPLDDRSIAEGTVLTIAAAAFDPNVGQSLTYSLDSGCPTDATIDPTTGVVTWRTSESDGPGQFQITVRATDNGSPSRSGSETFTATVQETNAAPILAPIGDRNVTELQTLSFTVTATDSNDVPPNQVTLSAGDLPVGAAFDAATGAFVWTPSEGQVGLFDVTFLATDDGSPSLYGEETITITVLHIPLTAMIDRMATQADPTKDSPIHFTVVFSEPVVDFGLDSVMLTGTAPGAVVSQVTGSDTTYEVEVSGMTEDGTVTACIPVGAVHAALGPANEASTSTDNTVTYDTTPPLAPVIARITDDTGINPNDGITSDSTLMVSGTAEARGTVDLTLLGTGVVGTTTADDLGSWSFDYSGTVLLEGNYQFEATVTDQAGNSSEYSIPATFVVDNTRPTISIAGPSGSFAAGGPITYTVTYADVNFNAATLAPGNVTLNKTGTAGGTVSVTGTGLTRTVTISGISGDGSLGISIGAGTASDLAGNPAPAASPSGMFVVDNTRPTISIAGPSGSFAAGGPITYTVTYADVNFNAATLAPGNVTLNKTGTAGGTVSVSGTNQTRTVTISGISGDGSLGISIGGGTASDLAGNSAPATGSSETFVVDNTRPTISIAGPSGSYAVGGPITYTVTYADVNFNSATLAPGSVTLNKTGTAGGTVSISGTALIRTVTISGISGDGSLGISIGAGTASDLAGNPAPATGSSGTFVVDNTRPTISVAGPSGSYTAAGPITYTVTYADVNFNSATLAPGNVTLNKTATAGGTVSVSGTGLTRTVTISGISGDGSLGISIGAGTASDLAGNPAPAAGSNATFVVDNTRPTAELAAPVPDGVIALGVLNAQGYLEVSLADAGSGLSLGSVIDGAPELVLEGAAASGVLLNPDPQQVDGAFRYQFTGSFGAGPVSVRFLAGSLADQAGNMLAVTTRSFTVLPVWLADDGEEGFSSQGDWTVRAGQGFRGDYRDNTKGKGTDTTSWSFAVPPGRYRIAVTWPGGVSDAATKAPFSVYNGTKLLGTVTVNQRVSPADFSDQGVAWRWLEVKRGASFLISTGTLVVKLTDKANGLVLADAVRIERLHDIQLLDGKTVLSDGGTLNFGTTWTGTPVLKMITVKNVGLSPLTLMALDPQALPAGFELTANLGKTTLAQGKSTAFIVRITAAASGSYQGTISIASNDPSGPYGLILSGEASRVRVLDDGDAGFKTVGRWQVLSGAGFANDCRNNALGQGKDTASWNFSVPNGQYRVAVTWQAGVAGAASNAPFYVYDGTKLLGTVTVDQRSAPDGFLDQGVCWAWLSLPGTDGLFSISGTRLVVKLTDKADGIVLADAVRIERMDASMARPVDPAVPQLDLLTSALAGLRSNSDNSWVDTTQASRQKDRQTVDAFFASLIEDK